MHVINSQLSNGQIGLDHWFHESLSACMKAMLPFTIQSLCFTGAPTLFIQEKEQIQASGLFFDCVD